MCYWSICVCDCLYVLIHVYTDHHFTLHHTTLHYRLYTLLHYTYYTTLHYTYYTTLHTLHYTLHYTIHYTLHCTTLLSLFLYPDLQAIRSGHSTALQQRCFQSLIARLFQLCHPPDAVKVVDGCKGSHLCSI